MHRWPLRVIGAQPPETLAKDKGKEQEERAGHFQPENAANAAEGAQKTASAACRAFDCLSSGAAGFSIGRCWRALRRGCGRLRGGGAGGNLFAGHASNYTETDSQRASNDLSSHFVMMVAALRSTAFFLVFAAACQLLAAWFGSKVEKSDRRAGHSTDPDAPRR